MKNKKIILASFILGTITGVGLSLLNPIQNKNITTKSLSIEDTPEVKFTPGDNCTQRIVDHILAANKKIFVQAYSFTSEPIINALITKHKKGVEIIIILDKTQEKSIYAAKIKSAGIKLLIDRLPGIAHNKIIIIDNEKVFTGSFNFSASAQTKNAENSILIKDNLTVCKYVQYFLTRLNICKKNNREFDPILFSKL